MLVLPVIGIRAVFTQVVFIEQFRLHIRQLRRQLAREQAHIGALFKDHRVMYGVGRIFTPSERTVRMNQYRRDLRRIQIALFKGFNSKYPPAEPEALG